jgi:Cof subfamily protein (haloacid dehalogenase superfamily)
MYRLIFCDLDGTVITYERVQHPAVHEAMQAVADAGRFITISSGRGYQLLKPFLSSVVINAPLVGCNGGLIVDPATREVLYVRPMPLAMAKDILHWCQSEKFEVWAYLDDLETMLEWRPDGSGAVLRRDGELVAQMADPQSALTRPPHKLIVLPGSAARVPTVLALLQRHLGDQARALASSPKVIEVILPGVSKADAMSRVATLVGVAREETLAIGDGDNDVEMLEWAACGIAMGNGTERAKAAADWIAPTVEEDGLAVALRRFVLEESSKPSPG